MASQTKKRVHEFAKELGVKAKLMKDAIQSITGANGHASSIITERDQNKIKAAIEGGRYKFPEKRNSGQVVFEYTIYRMNLIGKALKMGMNQADVAHLLGIAPETFSRHIHDGLHPELTLLVQRSKSRGEYYLTKHAHRQAFHGDSRQQTAMTAFILKCKHGWREKQSIIHEGGDKPIKIENEKTISIEELKGIPLKTRKKWMAQMEANEDQDDHIDNMIED
jgi:hypothetical protein